MALAYRKNHQGKIKERDSAVIKKAEKIDLPGWANSNERFYIMYVIQNRTVRLPCNWEVPSARGESVEDIKGVGNGGNVCSDREGGCLEIMAGTLKWKASKDETVEYTEREKERVEKWNHD